MSHAKLMKNGINRDKQTALRVTRHADTRRTIHLRPSQVLREKCTVPFATPHVLVTPVVSIVA